MGEADTAVVIVAGGFGERFGRPEGKQLATVAGRPLLAHTVEACCAPPEVALVVVVVPPDRIPEYADAVSLAASSGVEVAFAQSGVRRQDSVAAGLAVVPPAVAYIAVHDGARPLVTAEAFTSARRMLDADDRLDGVVVGHPSFDTLKEVEGHLIVNTPDRARFWVAQTPQLFRSAALRTAYQNAARDSREATDDASLVEASGGYVGVVQAARDNIKVTVATDLAIVEAVVAQREREARS